ncbi:DUF6663 family protein [Halobaculum limi]|uniref:DUF6663 family protein n=1 Tax=Halobaculum limi TaxID=3031916 RepID=UPI002407043F|nr:DUF6663 family protein [Halobaculum sp. YSMS11]
MDGSDDSVDPWSDGADDDWVAEATESDDGASTATADAGRAESATAPDPVTETDSSEPASLGPRHYRVLDVGPEELVFVDLDTPDPGPGPGPDEGFEPVRVAVPDEAAATGDAVSRLEPGYVVTASLRWPDADDADDADEESTPLARVESLSVDRESRYWFVDGVDPMFEAARETWESTRADGEGMGSRVTRDTDGEPNGALYVFAEAGARDLLGEFQSGTTPLEPLVDRVNEDLGDDDPRAVFVLRPASGGYVAVYIAFAVDGLLARTVRDTYC